jgi:hypothetical protein
MVTKKQVIEKYGKEMWDKMCATGWLDAITVTLLPDGDGDIPESDIDRAFRAANGKYIHPLEWD